jgi:hypothetical protein
MTREEIRIQTIAQLERVSGLLGVIGEEKDWTEYAIRALEQEPILDKIRAEIETKYGQCDICEYFEDYDYEENDISEYRPIGDIADILQIIDKYKAESKPQESEE